jgi:OOP family OmpA-OmpF porin
MKKFYLTPIAFTLAASAAAAHATEGVYIGIGYGNTEMDTGVTAVTASLDEKDKGPKILIGYEYTTNISLEGFYVDFGKATLSGDAGDTFISNSTTLAFTNNGTRGTTDQKTYGAAIVLSTSPYNGLKGFAKLGMHHWDYEERWSATGVDLSSDNLDDSGTDAMYGLGVSFGVNDNVAIRAEYEKYELGGEGSDTDYLSLGMTYKF